jgi:hypothetical protein
MEVNQSGEKNISPWALLWTKLKIDLGRHFSGDGDSPDHAFIRAIPLTAKGLKAKSTME